VKDRLIAFNAQPLQWLGFFAISLFDHDVFVLK